MVLAALGFYLQSIYFLITVLFFMGCQSTLFGPVKYSILPQHLNEEGLLKGNGIIEMGTFLAILTGTLVGGIVIMFEGEGELYICILVITIALVGWLSSRKIPLAESANKELKLNFNIFTETFNIIVASMHKCLIYGAILAISWFWFIGATILAILPGYTREILHGNEQVVTLLLTLFSVGIGVGSIIAGKSKDLHTSIKWIVIGTVGISIFVLAVYLSSALLVEADSGLNHQELQGWLSMFAGFTQIQILVSILMLGISGGFYIVPLYVILQECSDLENRSRTIASNNIVNALFMVISAVITMVLLNMGMSLYSLFAVLGCLNVFICIGLYWRFAPSFKQI